MGTFDTLNAALASDPGYAAALAGRWTGPSGRAMFPVGTDGLVLPGFRKEAARYYAELQQGGGVWDQGAVNDLYRGGSAQINDQGQWSDPNANHWYTDPKILALLAGGAVTGGAALAGGSTAPALGGGSTLAANLGGAGALGAGGAAGAAAGGAGAAGTAAAAGGGSSIARAIANTGGQVAQQGGTDWVKVLGPLLGLGATAATGGFRSPQVGIDPTISAQIAAVLGQQTARAQRTTPVHEAAMALAQQLAPTGTTSPRLQAAIAQAGRPIPSPSLDPQVAEAMARLMGGAR